MTHELQLSRNMAKLYVGIHTTRWKLDKKGVNSYYVYGWFVFKWSENNDCYVYVKYLYLQFHESSKKYENQLTRLCFDEVKMTR